MEKGLLCHAGNARKKTREGKVGSILVLSLEGTRGILPF